MKLASLVVAIVLTSTAPRTLSSYEAALFHKLEDVTDRWAHEAVENNRLERLLRAEKRYHRTTKEKLAEAPVVVEDSELLPWLIAGLALVALGAVAFHDITEESK